VRQVVQRPLDREDYGLSIKVAELDKGDNLQLVQSAKTIIDGFAQLHEKGLIGDQDLVDLLYRFGGDCDTKSCMYLLWRNEAAHNPMFYHWYATRTCGWSNSAV
jgi:hypothetical protein